MFFNSLNRKLKKSYAVLNKEIQPMVFPHGEPEYIYVGTILNTLFKKRDVFNLIQIYASVYTYFKIDMGNPYTSFIYAKKKAAGVLSDNECKTLIALVTLNITSNKGDVSDPIAVIDVYRRFVDEYLSIVEGVKKNLSRFKTEALSAGTEKSPLLVSGISGIHKYIGDLKVPGVEKISFSKNSTIYLTDNYCNVSYAIDEYTLTNAADGATIASLWFNIYGTENTDVQPVCFSDKTPFSASAIAPELFSSGLKHWASVERICQNAQVPFDHKKLMISTFAYFYEVWLFGFKGIRLGQATELEEMYVGNFVQYNRVAFKGVPERQILDNEQILKDMLKRVDSRIRASYHVNNYTLVDDGLTDEYICEFILNVGDVSKIKVQIESKIMEEWKKRGQEASQTYLT